MSKYIVKLCYHELGYIKDSVITNKIIYLIGSGHFMIIFPGYNEQNLTKIENKLVKLWENFDKNEFSKTII
jgi:hypothetical protein